MLIKCLPVGHLMTNCYIVTDETTLECAVIDPGDEAPRVLDMVARSGCQLQYILLTHGHYAHFAGAAVLQEHSGAKILASAPDEPMYSSAEKCWADFMPVEFRGIKPDKLYSDGEEFTAEGLKFRVMASRLYSAATWCS